MQTNNRLREALEALVDVIDKCDSGSPLWWHSGAKGVKPLKDAHAALAEPVKNCEVGTAEEQSERFDKFCHENINVQRCCGDCPAFRTTRDDCELVWAQLPYEAKRGGAK